MHELDPRRQRLWELQDFATGHGLEVGPLHDPIVDKQRADVGYVDIADRSGLVRYYQDHPGIPVDRIPVIDYPLTLPDGRIRSLAEAAGGGAPFDWVVASHVIEHVPDLIEWLAQLAEVSADGAALVLVVPDRRYCFDVHRPPTTVGEMLEAHRLGAVRPGVRAVYDHYSRAVRYDAESLWRGDFPTYDRRYHSAPEAMEKVTESLHEYVDCHVWLFTPDSLVEQLHELRLLDRSQWYVDRLSPTVPGEIEFMVRLRRLPRGTPATVPVADELAPETTRPDWLVHPAVQRRVEELERQVDSLRTQLAGRRRRVARLRRRVQRQRAVIRRLRAEREVSGDASAGPGPVGGRARRLAGLAVRRWLPRR